MDQQMHDALYNKTIKDVTRSDLKLYEEILGVKSKETQPLFEVGIASAIAIPLSVFLFSFALTLPIWFGPLALCSIMLVLGGGFNLLARMVANEWRERLGLTKKEFKAFKKSGGIKRIKNILKEYKKNPYNATTIYPLPNGIKVEDFETEVKQKIETYETKIKEQQKKEHEQEIDEIYSQVVAKFDDQQER